MSLLLVNCRILVGGQELSGVSNSINVNHAAEMLDDTTFQPTSGGDGTRSMTPGLKTIEVTGNMFFDPDYDALLFSRLGFSGEVVSVAALGESEGDVVHITQGVRGSYNPMSGEVGQLISAQLDLKNRGYDLVRAQLMTTGVKTTTGNSTGINMGSAANKRIFSALHVKLPVTAGGGSEQIVGIIQSDDNSGFSSATTRLTHATMTAQGADWQQAAIGSGITDNWWRARWTISGTAPSFEIFWSFGIRT